MSARAAAGATQRRKRAKPDPVKAWLRGLARRRPNLMNDTLAAMREMYGLPAWQRVHDPTSELVLTILSQNSADVNAERAFDALCDHWPAAVEPGTRRRTTLSTVPAGAGGASSAASPTGRQSSTPNRTSWSPSSVRVASHRRRRRASRRHCATCARRVATTRSNSSPSAPRPKRWPCFTAIPGIGRKTASVVLLFSFGMPLMPVDRHIERVAKRIGLIPRKASAERAHDMLQAQLAPERVHEAHVNLITHGRQTCHALRPACYRCAIASRCRFFNPKAP